MAFDLNFLGTFDTGGGDTGGGTPGGASFEQMTFSDPPTLAELEQLYRERWHTRPDWMASGATPKVVGIDALPAGASYNAGSNLITVTGTIADFSGWDFLQTQTTIFITAGGRINNFEKQPDGAAVYGPVQSHCPCASL